MSVPDNTAGSVYWGAKSLKVLPLGSQPVAMPTEMISNVFTEHKYINWLIIQTIYVEVNVKVS